MKKAWLYSCLINISGQPNKFVPDDRFGKYIIMRNKENIIPFANAKSDEFLWETVSRNILSLWNSKAVLLQAARSILHGNQHSTISNFSDVYYLVIIFANKSAFKKQLGQGLVKIVLPDLFPKGTTLPARGVSVANYTASL